MTCNATQGFKVEVETPDGIRTVPSYLRVWHKAPQFMSLITKDNPDIIAGIRVGDKISLKYYGEDSSHPCERLVTVIRKISRGEKGSLRGQYVVDVEILACGGSGGWTASLH